MPLLRGALLVACGTAACGRGKAPAGEHVEPPTVTAALRASHRVAWSAPMQLGLPSVWAVGEVAALRYCPDGAELLILQTNGELHRFRVSDGLELGVTRGLLADEREPTLDCRSDGTALVLGAGHRITLVGRNGKASLLPATLIAERAVFADNEDVCFSDAAGLQRWRDGQPEIVAKGGGLRLTEHCGYVRDAANGSVTYHPAGRAATTLAPASTMAPRFLAARNGTLLMQDEQTAWAWQLRQGKASKPILVAEALGSAIDAAAVSERWLVAVDGNHAILMVDHQGKTVRHGDSLTVELAGTSEPTIRRTQQMPSSALANPCDDGQRVAAVAIAPDDVSLAVACRRGGLSFIEFDKPVVRSYLAARSVADALVWSPDGSMLGTYERLNGMRIWRDGALLNHGVVEMGSWPQWSGDMLQMVVDDTIVSMGRSGATTTQPFKLTVPNGGRLLFKRHDLTLVYGVSKLQVITPTGTRDIALSGVDMLEPFEAQINAAGEALIRFGVNEGEPATALVAVDTKAGTATTTQIASVCVAQGPRVAVVGLPSGKFAVLRNGKSTTLGREGEPYSVLAVSKSMVAAVRARTIEMWSLDGVYVGSLPSPTLQSLEVADLAFSPDGKQLAGASNYATYVWQVD